MYTRRTDGAWYVPDFAVEQALETLRVPDVLRRKAT